jgi:UDP-N-acetylmuramoyl-tripeptide--D-alanyl-D-alanine ligase
MKHEKKIVILGDMFELGEDEAAEHRKLAERINTMSLAQCLTAGEASKKAALGLDRVRAFAGREDLLNYVSNNMLEDSLILIKASRGMGLEEVAELINH